MHPNVVPPEMQAAALKHRGYSMAHRVITTRWLHIHKKLQFVINPYIWPLNSVKIYPRQQEPKLISTEIKETALR